LTGLEPTKTAQPDKGPRFYDRMTRGLRLQDGTGRAVVDDQHPDPVAEACRWQICEGELIQALGRARGVNRTADQPLTIEVWSNVVLPLTIHEVVPWDDVMAGAEIEMMANGVVLTSPSDMARCWPDVWETEKAAERWRADHPEAHKPPNPYKDKDYIGFWGAVSVVRYQHPGARQKWRTAYFDRAVVPDPRAWLETRLGRLADFEFVQDDTEAAPDQPSSDPVHLDALDRLFDQAAGTVHVHEAFTPEPRLCRIRERWSATRQRSGAHYVPFAANPPRRLARVAISPRRARGRGVESVAA
jgi:hypothetical protein